MQKYWSQLTTFLGFLFLGIAYLTIVPVNAGPEEINHVQAAWYLSEKPTRIFSKELQVTSEFPNSIRISNPGGYLRNLDCFSQQMEIPSSCQVRTISGNSIETVPLIKRSLIYPMILGASMHNSSLEDKFLVARVTSFILCYVLLAAGLILLGKAKYNSNVLFVSVTSSMLFLFVVVNPSSLEISTAIFFTSIVLTFHREIRFRRTLFWTGFLLLSLNRSLGSLWALLIIFLYFSKTGRYIFPKSTFVLGGLTALIQYLMGNTNYPLSSNNEFQPPWNFYFEEAIRVFNGSGDWILSIWGVLSWSEIKLPLILVFLNFTCLIMLFTQVSRYDSKQKRFTAYSVVALFVFPFSIAVAFSRDWPGFWQGRYTLPLFLAVVIFGLSNLRVDYTYKLLGVTFLVAAFSQIYMALLTYARFNWGLYGTNTPIIANGNSFSFSQNISFFVFLILFISCVFIQSIFFFRIYNFNTKKMKEKQDPRESKQYNH